MADVAYVALGSNLGDRHAHLRTARERIAALPGTRILRESEIEETEPVGPLPQGAFLNQMSALETTLELRALRDELHRIERAAGRIRGERWGPRTLDLDIVMVEGRAVSEPALTVPHPELPARDFWQRELAQVRLP